MRYPNRDRALRQLDRHQQAPRFNPGGVVQPAMTPVGPVDLTALNETFNRQREGARAALAAMGRTLQPFLDSLARVGL
jgi:hypothetical protein